MEEALARRFEKSLQVMRLSVIKAKGGKGVEGLTPLPDIQPVKKVKKKKERGENE